MNETRAQRLRLLLYAGLLAPVLMALAGLALAFFTGKRLPNLGHGLTPAAVGLGALATAGSMGLVWLLYRVHPALEKALRRSGMQVGLDALEVAGYPVMIVVVTAAAFGEEILFRGGLQPIIGIVPAAFLFGFSHGGWRREMWAYVVAAALSGTVFGVAYWLTGNIWVPVSGHAMHNILSTALMGKKLEMSWDGWLPRVRVVPEPLEDEDENEVPVGESDEPQAAEQVAEALVAEELVAETMAVEAPTDEDEAAVEHGAEHVQEDALEHEEVAADVAVDEPVSPAPDGQGSGPDDGDPPDRTPQ